MRPHYIVQDQFQCTDVNGNQCHLMCHSAILSVKGDNGMPLYTVDRLYDDIHVASEHTRDDTTLVISHPTYRYKLNDAFTPI